ncbi:MAG: VOC family protein [Myxococcota bacterium]
MIRVQDIAYVRFGAPDLDAMERFAAEFGLVLAARQGGSLYHRGTDPSPYIHVTEEGEPGYRGVAFEAASAADLEAASKLDGASGVEKLDAPGGGHVVRFRDPDGHGVEVVHGRELLPALPVPTGSGINRGSHRERFGTLHRPPSGPSSVKRLGHVGIRGSDFRTSADWYASRFGFIPSDEVALGEDAIIAAFLRCDRGDTFTDHHTLVCIGAPEPGLDHAAFEVEDLDTLMMGHEHLVQHERDHHAGIGRHILGSQIFDYWKDPWGHVVEHFADGDLLNASHPTERHGPDVALGTLWGRFGP